MRPLLALALLPLLALGAACGDKDQGDEDDDGHDGGSHDGGSADGGSGDGGSGDGGSGDGGSGDGGSGDGGSGDGGSGDGGSGDGGSGDGGSGDGGSGDGGSGDGGSGDGGSADEGIPALGGGTHELGRITLTTIGNRRDGLDVPRDLAFNPEVGDELWVVNQADDSVTIYFDAGLSTQTSEHIIDPYALHFMEEVSSIDFGAPGTFGTCQESRNTYNDNYAPNDFMGPTLWSSDLDVFGQSNPEAIEYLSDLYGFYVDLGSHLDMQHETPLCVGIAWQSDNLYWAFDGLEGSIDRVDFGEDHGAGYDDHSDGITATYIIGELDRVADVPGHLVYDHDSALLYIADTGNSRVAVLDTTSGTRGANRSATERGTRHFYMDDADSWTLVEGSAHGLTRPSGLALHDDVLYVTDHGSGTVFAFDLEGTLLDYLDLDVAGLMGIEVRSDEDIWVTDADGHNVLRLQPR